MESPTRVLSPPSAALYPASPEKLNRLQPQSPGTPTMDPFISRTPAGDVQGKVAQFNNLSKEASQRRKDNEAALRRAVLGREEAESETKRLKEENKSLREKVEEGRAREMRVAKKFEAFGEEKRKLIDHQHKCQQISEQEVRRARKEAFRYSSALVTAQEDVQKARGHMEKLREQADIERHRGKKYQQEAFDAQLALAGMEEEVESLKRKLRTAEEEREALKTTLGEEQVARIAAEGRLPLPAAYDPEDEFASPRKSKARRISARRESLKENMDPAWKNSNDIFDIMWAAEEGDEFAIAKRNLWVEEKRRQEAEMMISYLKAEYEHKPCSCEETIPQAQRQVSKGEKSYVEAPIAPGPHVLDGPVLEAPSHDTAEQVTAEDTIVHHTVPDEPEETLGSETVSPSTRSEPPPFAIHEDELEMTLANDNAAQVQPIGKTSLVPLAPSISPSLLDLDNDKENSHKSFVREQSILSIKSEDIETSMSYSITPREFPAAITEPAKMVPRHPSPVYKSHTTTTSVPLKTGESPVKKQGYPFSPGATMTREQALEAIKKRRGRAKSAHGTSRTPMKPDVRNISSKSAPAM